MQLERGDRRFFVFRSRVPDKPAFFCRIEKIVAGAFGKVFHWFYYGNTSWHYFFNFATVGDLGAALHDVALRRGLQ